jgi:hypothetical protein
MRHTLMLSTVSSAKAVRSMSFEPIDPRLLRFVGDPYVTGDVDEDVFERLCELTENPSQFIWPAHGGITQCERCRFTGGCDTTYRRASSGGRSHPSYRTVTHDIDAHGYCPPPEFCEAVLRCPPMHSMEYLKSVLENGGRELQFAGGKP